MTFFELLILLGLLYEIYYLFNFRHNVKKDYVFPRYNKHVNQMGKKYGPQRRYKLFATIGHGFRDIFYSLHYVIILVMLMAMEISVIVNEGPKEVNNYPYMWFMLALALDMLIYHYKRKFSEIKPNFKQLYKLRFIENIYLIGIYLAMYIYFAVDLTIFNI